MTKNDPEYTLSRARLMRQSAIGQYARAFEAYEVAKAAMQDALQAAENAELTYELALAAAVRAGLTK